MSTSWRPGCPVPLSGLRLLTVSHIGMDGAAHTGELVVAASVADDVVTVFRRLYEARFPIRSLRLVDDFGGSDDASMAADNTSAFNCRAVTGGTTFSEHAYGTAIDINPVENPYRRGSTVAPPAGRAFLNRPRSAGVIHAGDVVTKAFADIGWKWGGWWSSSVDYQHFSPTGR
jgi:D-alanyl-D-alanine carboxypeptidase